MLNKVSKSCKNLVAVTQPSVPRNQTKWTMWRWWQNVRNTASLQIRYWVCTPSNEALRIWLTKTLQLRYFGCAPPPYFGSQIIVPWDIPSLCGSRTLPPVPLSVLVYFSFLECLASYRPFVVLCLGFEPGRHSSVDNTLTIKRFCLVVIWFRPVYI